MFRSRASVSPTKVAGFSGLRQRFNGKDLEKASKSFEEILDQGSDQSSTEEETKEEEAEKEKEEEEALHDKVQAEEMKEIEKKKESEQNYASSQTKC